MIRSTRRLPAHNLRRGLTLAQGMILTLACMLILATYVRALDQADDVYEIMRIDNLKRYCRKCIAQEASAAERRAILGDVRQEDIEAGVPDQLTRRTSLFIDPDTADDPGLPTDALLE